MMTINERITATEAALMAAKDLHNRALATVQEATRQILRHEGALEALRTLLAEDEV